MARGEAKRVGWFPLRGSWEEAVLSWNEQVDMALRRRKGAGLLSQDGELKGGPAELDSSGEFLAAEKEAEQASLAT